MRDEILKKIAFGCYLIGITAAFLLLFRYLIIDTIVLRMVFYIGGGLGLTLNLVRYIQKKVDSSFLFWLGAIGIYIGLIFKTLQQPFSNYIIIISLAISVVSTFYNPFESKKDDNDGLLD
jgi:hypothetical protein